MDVEERGGGKRESVARAEFGVRSITSVANEVRQILWPDGDDAISAIDAVHTLGEYYSPTSRASLSAMR